MRSSCLVPAPRSLAPPSLSFRLYRDSSLIGPSPSVDSEEEQHESGRVQDGADYQLGPAVAPFDDEASWEEHGLREFAAYNPGRTSEAADL